MSQITSPANSNPKRKPGRPKGSKNKIRKTEVAKVVKSEQPATVEQSEQPVLFEHKFSKEEVHSVRQ